MYVSDCIQIILLSYALGSIPFGVVLAKLFGLPDPRYIGSGNIGATNMLRTGNKKVALLTLALDALKGAVAVWLTAALFSQPVPMGCEAHLKWTAEMEQTCVGLPHYPLLALAVLAAAVGHMYSPWLKFKGGKGVATLFGGVLAFSWPVGLAGFFIWAIVFYCSRYVSLASVITLLLTPFVAWLRVDGTSALILGLAALIAVWKHRGNIDRLRKGFEPRMRFGKGSTP